MVKLLHILNRDKEIANKIEENKQKKEFERTWVGRRKKKLDLIKEKIEYMKRNKLIQRTIERQFHRKEQDMVINFKHEITSSEALSILCQTLHMEWVLIEDKDFVVKNDSYGELIVYEKNYKTGELKPYDDRGHLFVAIRNLIVQMYPNVEFRNEDYIYDN